MVRLNEFSFLLGIIETIQKYNNFVYILLINKTKHNTLSEKVKTTRTKLSYWQLYTVAAKKKHYSNKRNVKRAIKSRAFTAKDVI